MDKIGKGVCWQVNRAVVQTNESVAEVVYTNTSAVIGTWNISAIATNTTNGLSDTHTWLWGVTLTATVTPAVTLAPKETPKRILTPTVVPGVMPKPESPGFEAVFAVAIRLTIAYTLLRGIGNEHEKTG